MVSDICKRKFRFYATDEFNNEYDAQLSIDEPVDIPEVEYMLDVYKDFLGLMSYADSTLNHLQYLENDELEILEKYRKGQLNAV